MTVTETDWAKAWETVRDIPGWLTEEQASMLFQAGARVQPGETIVEIGSYWGRSTILLALAAPPGVDIVAIDPYWRPDHVPHTGPQDGDPGNPELEEFLSNLRRAGVVDRVRHVRKASRDALAEVTGSIALLYVDGGHDFATARSDVRDWGARVAPGGTMLVHDSYSSTGVVATQLLELVFGSRFRYLGRSRSLAEYRREPVKGPVRVANATRQLLPLPWFLRNVLVKVAIVTDTPRLARALGHNGREYPY